MRRFAGFILLFGLVAIFLLDGQALAHSHTKVVPLPAGLAATADQREGASKPPTEDKIDEGRPPNLNGNVKISSGSRQPAIAMVGSIGATQCRTSGIIPPLGVDRFGERGIGGLPICPAAPGQPASAPPPPTPLEAAYYAWIYIIDLPSPTASTQPTVGITGLDTFLTIQGQQEMVVDVPALGYSVHFDITSVYDIDWGDPRPDGSRTGAAVTKNVKDQGGPYPNGTLRHQYIERGSAEIAVIQRWSATWSAAGEGGSLPDSVETTGSLSLPIQEIQALVTG